MYIPSNLAKKMDNSIITPFPPSTGAGELFQEKFFIIGGLMQVS
jgi:hypothetical protein